MRSSALYRQLHARITAEVRFLPDKPRENADSTLSALWLRSTGTFFSAERAIEQELKELDSTQHQLLQSLIQRRIEGVPLSHLTERQHFMGLEMLAGPQALVPRAETELLVRAAIPLAREAAGRKDSVMVIDCCTGSGNIALAIAQHVPQAKVYAADLSQEAVEFARRNAAEVQLASRVQLRAGNLLEPFDEPAFIGQVDLLTCNPPYISSAKVKQMPGEIAHHEPSLAFDGGPFGVSVLMRLLQQAPRFLRPGAWLVFEVGLGQGPALARRLRNDPAFDDVHEHADAGGDVRAIAARRKPD